VGWVEAQARLDRQSCDLGRIVTCSLSPGWLHPPRSRASFSTFRLRIEKSKLMSRAWPRPYCYLPAVLLIHPIHVHLHLQASPSAPPWGRLKSAGAIDKCRSLRVMGLRVSCFISISFSIVLFRCCGLLGHQTPFVKSHNGPRNPFISLRYATSPLYSLHARIHHAWPDCIVINTPRLFLTIFSEHHSCSTITTWPY
jgi:hypothetical protein